MTSQKQKVLEYLKSTNKHPTAEKVYKEVKKDLPRISKSTIYRILDKYSGNKRIKKLELDPNHFDATTSDHAHFVCKKCGKVRDLHEIEIPKIKRSKYGPVKKAELLYYGTCKECLEE